MKAIYVFCMDITFLIRTCLDNSMFMDEGAWLAAISRLPDLTIGSVMQDLHQSLTIAVSVAAIEGHDKKKVRKPKKGSGQGSDANSDSPKKVKEDRNKEDKSKDDKNKKGNGICFKALITADCPYGVKCRFDHVDPKPSEYGEVKEYIIKNNLVVKVGVKLE